MSSIRYGAFRLHVFPNDHDPAHVHVFAQKGVIRFALEFDGSARYLDVEGPVSNRDIRRAKEAVEKNHATLLGFWKQYHVE